MPKYPCGECGIGVKYSAILCTGPCNSWYHGGCVSISDRCLKKLTKEETNTWTCKICNNTAKTTTIGDTDKKELPEEELYQGSGEAQIQCFKLPKKQSTPKSSMHDKSSPILNDLQSQRYTGEDSQNQSLDELTQRLLENDPSERDDSLALAAKIGAALLEENQALKTENSKLITRMKSLEAQAEEHEQNEAKYFLKLEELQQTACTLELKLEQEKQHTSGTQTDPFTFTTTQPSTAATEVSYLQKTHRLLEEKFKTLETNLNTSLERESCCETKPTNQLRKPINNLRATGWEKSPLQQTVVNKKKNVFSVSLQIAKHRESEKSRQLTIAKENASTTLKITCNTTLKSPPILAKKLGKNESYEEFFKKNIKHYQQINENYNIIRNSIRSRENEASKRSSPIKDEDTSQTHF
ncbi:hypothetical protein J6590_081285 [Homalodisca vitripennis]|nr:hypothetical protein J6590_081285 [Homalodisca vitripennis]